MLEQGNRVIQGFWTGPLTTMERLCVNSFLANGHEFHLYTYNKMTGVPAGCVWKDANEILPEDYIKKFKYVQQFADYFRYMLLLKKGGWWVDMDVICLKPFDFKEPYLFVESTGEREKVLNFAVIKVPVDCPLIKDCVFQAEAKRSQWSTMGFQDIGPDMWARTVAKFGLGKFIQPIDRFDPVKWNRIPWIIDPSKKFDLTECYALHLFHAAWNRGNSRPSSIFSLDNPGTDANYPDGCLYELLKKRYLPKVSIVVTTINRAPLLRKTLNSIVSQSFKDYEIVVIDDGTDTETPALCAEPWPFTLRYFRLNRMKKPGYYNQSIVANFGVRQACGEIVILNCAECLHVGNVLQDLVDMVKPDTVALCRADHLNIDGTVNPAKTDYMNIVREHQALFFCGAIYKDWFYRLRGFDETYERFYGADDNDFSDRLLYAGAKFVYPTSSYVQHQWHPIATADPLKKENGEWLTKEELGKTLLESQQAAHRYQVKNTADMKAGLLSPIRNRASEWGKIVDISVVITTFNRPALLKETLLSIQKQEIEHLEIVVVDDGTDSETATVCKNYGATYVRVNRPQSTIYRNPARPINIGVRCAKGKIILLQNAECKHVDPGTIEKLTKSVTDDNAVFAHVMGTKPDGSIDGPYCGPENPRPFFFCGAINKSWFEKLRGIDEDYPGGGFDDDDFGDRLKVSGVNFVFTDVLVIHQWHPHLGSLSTTLPLQMYKEKSAQMKDGKITPVRNLGRDWGILGTESIIIPCAYDFVPFTRDTVATPVPDPVSVHRLGRYQYDKSGLVTNWWDRHSR
jgi:glycosyltransferase involved in cell wall biosynthesis